MARARATPSYPRAFGGGGASAVARAEYVAPPANLPPPVRAGLRAHELSDRELRKLGEDLLYLQKNKVFFVPHDMKTELIRRAFYVRMHIYRLQVPRSPFPPPPPTHRTLQGL